ncbi:MAG: hypothetical protein U0S50_08850 [Sphingopyxis sp.]|uniref:hypothetical protein n=1 Tax=Sphingopyxis sp. TaxID=1908224 RepID=UPI002AB88EA2|nr:hypothetical protein [Sphingopyxis sp.]MDZ3831908.1 hypothetical protein [Sphingopyxis sp.]
MNDMPPLPPASGRSMTDREAETAQFMALLQAGRHKSALLLELARTSFAKYLALAALLLAAALCGVTSEAIGVLARLGWG